MVIMTNVTLNLLEEAGVSAFVIIAPWYAQALCCARNNFNLAYVAVWP